MNNHPRVIVTNLDNINLKILDIHEKISILYYPIKIGDYNKSKIYPQIRSDNKIQINLYVNVEAHMYEYNFNLYLILIRRNDWNYYAGYYINNENQITEITSVNQLTL